MHNNIFSNIIYINILVFYLDETISYLCFLSLFNYVSSLGIRSFFRTHGDTGMLYFGAGKLFVVRRVSTTVRIFQSISIKDSCLQSSDLFLLKIGPPVP